MDLAGTLPTEEEVIEFTKDQDPDKRAKLVERLMQTVGYAGWWTTKLCDWTGNSDPQLRNSVPNQSASALWYEWIYKRVQQNVPYDQIVQGIVEAKSRNQGETYIDYCSKMSEACREPEKFADREGMTLFWARNNFRTAEDRAVGFAYSFLGIRIQCAQCHKHPFDQWTKADFEKFSKLFGQVALNGNNLDVRSMTGTDKEMLQTMLSDLKAGSLKGNDLRKKLADKLKEGETVPFPELSVRTVAVKVKPQQKGKDKQPVPAGPGGELLGGGAVSLSDDTRDDLMAWLRSAENPYFAKALVNRVWAHYFGVGIVNPPDDLNLANPPSNAALLDHLAKEFIAHNFDLQWLHRTIIASDTYQRSWETNETNIHDRRNFSRFVPRRLPAEVLYDAMLIATSNDSRQEKLTSERKGRAVNVTDFDQRRSNAPYSYALGVFGRSTRESNCDCDRSEEPSLLQTVFLRNDKEVLQNLTSETVGLSKLPGLLRALTRRRLIWSPLKSWRRHLSHIASKWIRLPKTKALTRKSLQS